MIEDAIKGALFFLYIGKLAEFNLVTGGYNLTPKGFDLAIDAYDKGLRLSDEEVLYYIDNTPGMEAIKFEVFVMVKHLQDVGFEEVKKFIEEKVNANKL